MNKVAVLALSTIILASCTQKKVEVVNPSQPEEVISYNAGVGIFTGSGDFGEVKKTDSKVLTLKITNTGDAPLQGPPSIDNANFAIIYQNGCATVAPNKACTVKVSFDAKGKATGESYEANFNLDSAFIALAASIPADITPPAQESIDFLSGSAVITSQDFGETAQNKNILKTISIKNKGSLPISSTAALSGSTAFSISYDACSGKSIAKNSSCIMKVNFASGALSGEIIGSLIYNGKSLSLVGNVSAPAEVVSGPPLTPGAPYFQVVALVNNVEQTEIVGGALSGSESKQIIINFKNLGNSPAPVASAALDNTNASIAYNQCSNKILAPNSSCQVRVIISASGKSANSYASVLSFGDKALPVSYSVGAAQAVITYEPIYSGYGACSINTPCAGAGVKTRSITACQKLSDGNPVSGGQLSDCAPFNIPPSLEATCLSPAGNISSNIQGGVQTLSCGEGSVTQTFVSVSCDNGYFIDGQLCSANVISYVPSYSSYGSCSASLACQGTGTQSRSITSCQKVVNGVNQAGGQITDCESFNISENLNQSCASPAGEIQNPITGGVQTLSCVAGSTTTSFVSVTCSGQYSANGEICELPALCNDSNAANYGYNTANTAPGSISGTVPNCTLTCDPAIAFASLATDGKSCNVKQIVMQGWGDAGYELYSVLGNELDVGQAGFQKTLMKDLTLGENSGMVYQNFISVGNKHYFVATEENTTKSPTSNLSEVFQIWEFNADTLVTRKITGEVPYNNFIFNQGYSAQIGTKFYFYCQNISLKTCVYDTALEPSATNPKIASPIFSQSLQNTQWSNLSVHNNKIMFTGSKGDAVGQAIYVYDPALPDSAANPSMKYDIRAANTSGSVFRSVSSANRAYFFDSNGTSSQLIRIDFSNYAATVISSAMPAAINRGTISSLYIGPDDKLYFSASATGTGYELYVYNPALAVSATNPVILGDFGLNTASPITTIGTKMYFKANLRTQEYNTSAAVSGTNPRVVEEASNFPNLSTAATTSYFAFNNKLYYSADVNSLSTSYQVELLEYDPAVPRSVNNPKVLKNNLVSSAYDFKVLDGKLFFKASDLYAYYEDENWNYDPSCSWEDEEHDLCTSEQYYQAQTPAIGLYMLNGSSVVKIANMEYFEDGFFDGSNGELIGFAGDFILASGSPTLNFASISPAYGYMYSNMNNMVLRNSSSDKYDTAVLPGLPTGSGNKYYVEFESEANGFIYFGANISATMPNLQPGMYDFPLMDVSKLNDVAEAGVILGLTPSAQSLSYNGGVGTSVPNMGHGNQTISVGIAYDGNNNKIWVSRDGVWLEGNPLTNAGGQSVAPIINAQIFFGVASYGGNSTATFRKKSIGEYKVSPIGFNLK